MRKRPGLSLRPGVESLEAKRVLSASPSATLHAAEAAGAPGASGDVATAQVGSARAARVAAAQAHAAGVAAARQARPPREVQFVLSRVTNPTPFNAILNPPFEQVLVQQTPPTTGRVVNVLFVSVRNSTRQTIDVNSNFSVRVTGQPGSFPVLTGSATWKPGQVMVFYILTNKYLPLRPVTSAGFEFDLGGKRGVAIPGPSGIFLRVKYDPAKFPATLDWIVAHGPGSKGHELGLPDTAIWEFTGR